MTSAHGSEQPLAQPPFGAAVDQHGIPLRITLGIVDLMAVQQQLEVQSTKPPSCTRTVSPFTRMAVP